MTTSALALPQPAWRPAWITARAPILVVVSILFVLWYLAAMVMNAPLVRDQFEREGTKYSFSDLIAGTLDAERPVVPAPHQVALELYDSIFGYPLDSPRNLAYHAWVTLSATLVGFALGAVFGILLAVLIVHVRTLEKSLLRGSSARRWCRFWRSPPS